MRTACGPALDLSIDHQAWPSPDDRWLVLTGPDRVNLYDLRTCWTQPSAVASWAIADGTSTAWLDREPFLVAGSIDQVVHLDTQDPSRTDRTAIFPSDGGTVAVIPRLTNPNG